MKRHLSETEARTTSAEQVQSQGGGLEFESVEELLRYDASQQAPSEQLQQRVANSAGSLPRRRWWFRWLPWK